MHYFRYVFFLNCLSLYFVWKSPANLLTHFPKNFCIPSFIFFLHISITLSKVHQLKMKIHFFLLPKTYEKETNYFNVLDECRTYERLSSAGVCIQCHCSSVFSYVHDATEEVWWARFAVGIPILSHFYTFSVRFFCLHLNLYQFCVLWKFRRFR